MNLRPAEVLVDELAQLVGIARPPAQPARLGLAQRALDLVRRLADQLGRLARELLGALVGDVLGAELVGDLVQPRGQSGEVAHGATPPRGGGAEDAVDEVGRVGAAELLREVHRLVDRDLGRHVVAVAHLVQRDAHDAELERRDPLERPAAGEAPDLLVELGRPRSSAPSRELARERLRVRRAARRASARSRRRW